MEHVHQVGDRGALPAGEADNPNPTFGEADVVGVRALVKSEDIGKASLIMDVEVAPERVGVPALESLDAGELAGKLAEATSAVDNEGRLSLNALACSNVLDWDNISLLGENSRLDVGLVPVPDINSVTLSVHGKKEFRHRTLDLVSRQEQLQLDIKC